MKTRTVSIALCGVVAGLLVGMAVFGIVNPDAVNASALAYREAINSKVLPRADALRRPKSTTQGKDDLTTSSAAARSSAAAEVAVPAVDSAECVVARVMAAAFDASIDQNVPTNFTNTQKRADLKAVGASFVSQYCPLQPAHAAAPVQVSSAAAVDNHCEQYGARTTRRVVCDSEQAAGRVYP